MKHKIFISIDGEWHKMYEPSIEQNQCDGCSLLNYCQDDEIGAPCTSTTKFKKVSEIK